MQIYLHLKYYSAPTYQARHSLRLADRFFALSQYAVTSSACAAIRHPPGSL